ncbi:YqcI/YcgG family protein [Radiobacillus kanasensis]|uniref:YqcI/YcgG family protein n=1 Tax=Radiobacillus kanasensis TaxID=2844358 RepID=UPI001E3062BD|nr:YqcI/YcgG family protein [Radiobacillus kanasensis]UFT99711.1 YqcI/YcgG family protein [Radiobacillus kanasensis]
MHLFRKNELEQSSEKNWRMDAFHAFQEKFTDKEHKFPCIPATQGFHLGQLRFGFLPSPKDPQTPEYLAEILEAYGKVSNQIGDNTSLVLFFNRFSGDEKTSVSDYETWYWDILQQVHEMDETRWPADIPEDPHHALWEYCFNGERYFLFCATPAHQNRQSRFFPYMMFAITPRWVFDTFLEKPPSKKLKRQIRERLKAYDSVEPHPDLKVYRTEENYEYKQYFLRDDQSSLNKCPFHTKKKD